MEFQDMVRQFHLKIKEVGGEIACPDVYIPLDRHTAHLRAQLILEEAKEFEAAAEVVGIGYPQTAKDELRKQIEMIDAICDTLYVAFGAAVAMGLDIRPFFQLVHGANMRKFEVGSYMREDGKWMKPPGWVEPDLAALLEEIEADECGNGEHR